MWWLSQSRGEQIGCSGCSLKEVLTLGGRASAEGHLHNPGREHPLRCGVVGAPLTCPSLGPGMGDEDLLPVPLSTGRRGKMTPGDALGRPGQHQGSACNRLNPSVTFHQYFLLLNFMSLSLPSYFPPVLDACVKYNH